MRKAYRLIIIVVICVAIAALSACSELPAPPDADVSPSEITPAIVVIENSDTTPDENASGDSSLIFVAHAGGFAEGYAESNSAEALRNSAQNGYTLIELDIITTSDGRFALAHDWEYMSSRVPLMPNEAVAAAEFLRYKWFGSLTTVMLDYLFEGFLDDFPNVRIITDTKRGDYSSLKYIAETYPDYIDRFIPQAYAFDDCEALRALGFDDIIVTVYTMPVSAKESPSQLAANAIDYGVYAMTVPFELASADGYAAALRTDEIRYFVHTVNSPEQAALLAAQGFYGVYTDTLTYSGGEISVLDDREFYANEAARFDRAIASFSNAEREILVSSVVCMVGSELVLRRGAAEMMDAYTMISCFEQNSVFFLPLRKMVEYLDAGTVVSATDGAITITQTGIALEFAVGHSELILRANDADAVITLPAPPTIYRNVCFVPQAVFEALGFRVTVSGGIAAITPGDSQYNGEDILALADKISELIST